MARKKQVIPETAIEIESIKGFNLDWTCRGFKFEVGKTYVHNGAVEVCESGFHAVENPLDAFRYYMPGKSRYAIVKQSGEISRHDADTKADTKIASAKITITAEIKLHDMIGRAVKWIIAQAKPSDVSHSEGPRSVASSAGDGSVASSAGDGSVASSAGDGSVASSAGYRSVASSAGDGSVASSAGYGSVASSAGYGSVASSAGDGSVAMSAGAEGRVMGSKGCALFLVYRDPNTGEILHAWAGIAGRCGIDADVWYRLDANGLPVGD